MGNIKRFNVKVNGTDSGTFDIGAEAKNVDFSEEATHPFKNEPLENSVPEDLSMKASNIIYGNAYLRNTRRELIDGVPNIDIEKYREAFGETGSDINPNHATTNAGGFSIAYGVGSVAAGHNSSAIGFDCEANGWASHSEGFKTITGNMSYYSHAEGDETQALHRGAHAEGRKTKSEGYASHAEGTNTTVQGAFSHGEGVDNQIVASKGIVQNNNSVIYNIEGIKDTEAEIIEEDFKTRINGQGSLVGGFKNIISGAFCFANGVNNKVTEVYGSAGFGEKNIISANNSLVVGNNNELRPGANNSIILGDSNINTGCPNSLYLGRYCSIESNTPTQMPAFIIGSGIDNEHRSNLISIRHPQNGAASSENKGSLWAQNLNAHFGDLSADTITCNTLKGGFGWEHETIDITAKVTHNQGSGQDFQGVAFFGEGNTFFTKRFYLEMWLQRQTGILHIYLNPFMGGGKYKFTDLQGNNTWEMGQDILYIYANHYRTTTTPDTTIYKWLKSYCWDRDQTAVYLHRGMRTQTWCYFNPYNFFNLSYDGRGEDHNKKKDTLRISTNRIIGTGEDWNPDFHFVFHGNPMV